MSGYKRVNFYELCRLCATNQQKDKTHIFQEEGRKIQLQNKIQNCLSLKVCENDFLPKVVCSQCLRTLEECSTFRKECYTSETMLSSYFNNFRYTEDFKKSGKVYIKDTSPKIVTPTELPVVATSTPSTTYNVSVAPQENLPYYTLHLPSVVPQQHEPKKDPPKIISQPQIVYNFNGIKAVVPNMKNTLSEAISNVTVNSNGEIITIAPLMDVDTLLSQNVIQKPQKKRKQKVMMEKSVDDGLIKIDLTAPQPEIKQIQQNKLSYAIKIDEPLKAPQFVLDNNMRPNFNNNPNQSVILNSRPPQRQKAYTNFNGGGLNIPSAEVLNLNPEPPPPPPPIVSLPVSTYYSKPDLQVDDTLANIFNTSTTTTQNVNFPNYPNVVTTEPKQQDKRHSCDICCKTFKRREHLYQHVKLHTGFRPFKCENCNKSFMRKEHLLRHMTSHSGQKNYTCNICDKSFSRNDNLLKHRKIHNKQNSFTCEICQKQFVMEHYYLAHKLTHDSDKCNQINPVWGLLKAV